MQSLAVFALRGRLQALVAICGMAFASTLLLPPLSLLSTALLALLTLRKGALESAWVLLLALAVMGASGLLLGGEAWKAVAYGALLWLPVWPAAIVLRETRRLEWALGLSCCLGLAGVVIVYLLVDNPAALWQERFQGFLRALLENAPPDFDATAMNKAADAFPYYAYLTGAIMAGSVLSVILGLLIARWQQAALFNPGGFRNEFVALRLRGGLVYTALACLAAGLLADGRVAEIAWNLNLVFSILFTISGFSILHATLGSKGYWIAGVYLALLFNLQLLLPSLALLGLSDPWLDWRKRSQRI